MASGNEFSSNIRANVNTELRQNLTIKGDIVVESGTHLIENVNLNLTGKIVASNDATVIIRKSTLFVTTPGYNFRDGILLADRARLIVENATVFLESANTGEESDIIVGNESIANITHSELHGFALVIGRQNSRVYVNHSILKGSWSVNLRLCGVITYDNSAARIQDSELDIASAGGNSSIYVSDSIILAESVSASGKGLVEVQNSLLGTVEWCFDNSTLHIVNSTVSNIEFGGLSLIVKDSRVSRYVSGWRNSTIWLERISTSRITAKGNSTIWLINSYAGKVEASDQGRVYVGWQLPLLGTVTVPHNWLPFLEGLAILTALILITASLIFLNRRWKRWQLQKSNQQPQTPSQT